MNYKQLLYRYPNYVGFGATHYFYSALGQTFLISQFVPYFNQSFQLSNTTFSIIYAVATISSAIIIPFAGKYVDKFKIRQASLMNGLAIAGFCLLLSFSHHVALLFISLLGLRFCGQGLMILIGSTGVARYFTIDRGKALSLSGLGLSLAETILPVAVAHVTGWLNWQAAWQLLALSVGLIFLPASLRLVKKDNPFQFADSPKQTEESSKINLSRKEVMADSRFYLILPVILFLPFFITGIFIHQNLLAAAKGWSIEWLATCFIGFGVTRILTSILAGPLVDKFTARKTVIVYLVPLLLALFVLMLGDHKWLAMFYMILLAMTASLSSLTSTALWAELYGVRFFGSIKSMVTTLMVFSTALGPIAIGSLLQNPDHLEIFLLGSMAIIILLITLAWIAIREYE